MKWLVIWTAVSVWSAPCPQKAPFTDAYGIYHAEVSTELVACFDNSRVELKREFETLEYAEAFIKNAPTCDEILRFYFPPGCIENVSIKAVEGK